jgi:hypothetical protein
LYLLLSAAVLIVTLTLMTLPNPSDVFAQVPAADTPTGQPTEPPTEVPTDVPTEVPTTVPTDVPTVVPTETTISPPETVQPVTPQPPAPVAIPEPITVVLFGTGLAALSAAAAARRKNESPKRDE